MSNPRGNPPNRSDNTTSDEVPWTPVVKGGRRKRNQQAKEDESAPPSAETPVSSPAAPTKTTEGGGGEPNLTPLTSTDVNVSLVKPEILYLTPLKLDEPQQFAKACEKLIIYFDKLCDTFSNSIPIMKLKYRLELVSSQSDKELVSSQNDNEWLLRIKLDAVAWFYYLIETKKSQSEIQVTSIARSFINESRKHFPNVVPGTNYTLVNPSNYCKFHQKCYSLKDPSNKPCPRKHAKMNCIGTPANECLFVFYDEFRIKPDGLDLKDMEQTFAIGVKRDPIREILLAPICHLTNRELVQKKETWTVVNNIYQYIKQMLPGQVVLEGIAANFGKWETASANNDSDYAMDCHGHIHIYLSRAAVDKLSENMSWYPIHARINNPDNYLESDCCELENVLLHQEVAAIKDDVAAVHTHESCSE